MKNSHSGLRIFFFLSIFCVAGLIVYFTLGRIYGYGELSSSGNSGNMNIASGKGGRLFPRSETEYEFLIIVFGWRRVDSLKRLMNSLLAAEYDNETIDLHFHIDFEPSEEVSELIETTKWPFGKKKIIRRHKSFGLERMVVNSWNATNDKEFAFFFEDDIEAHPKFFKFALEAIKKPEIINNSDLVGIGLTTPRYDEINMQRSIWNPAMVIGSDSKLFYYQIPCSWGALYFPWKWREYLHYYQTRRPNSSSTKYSKRKVIVPRTSVTNWDKSWKKFYIEMMVLKGYVMLYPSLPNQASLSVNHREEGEHTGNIKGLSTHVDYFQCPFATAEQVSILLEALNDSKALPIVNVYHLLSNSKDLKEFGDFIHKALKSGQKLE